MNLKSLSTKIEKIIREVEQQYQNIQGLILSESDLKCLIYRKLYKIFSLPTSTIDEDIKAIALHTEIPWYDERGRLSIYPDITIFSSSNLSIKHGISMRFKKGKFCYGKIPSKGFEFAGKSIIIEIKFIREKRGITERDISKFRNDINKILRLRERVNTSPENNEILGIVVIFNKTNKGKFLFDQFLKDYNNIPGLKIVYSTGNVKI